MVINSLHKTLPSLTQTALIHMQGPYANKKGIRKYLHMLQSSSPSYVLMASIDACVSFLAEEGEEVFGEYASLLKNTRDALSGLEKLRLLEGTCFDPSKLVISVDRADISSHELTRRLWEDYHLEMEMTAGKYVLAMTAVGDTHEGMKRLVDALFAIDQGLEFSGQDRGSSRLGKMGLPSQTEICLRPYEASGFSGTSREWQQAVGCISREYAYLYPPGCPLLVPGERVSQETVDMLQWYRREGFDIEGLEQEGFVTVLEDIEI